MLGHSPKVAPTAHAYYSLHSQVEAVIEVIDALREIFDSSVNLVLVGHSVGAWVVLQVSVYLHKAVRQSLTPLFGLMTRP